MTHVDIGNPETWPADVTNVVAAAIRRAPEPDWREYPFDHLKLPPFHEDERQLRVQLGERRIIGYHATRLLPHEIVNMRDLAGLEILTEDLRERKVGDARAAYPEAFDADPEGSELLRSGPNHWQGTANVRLGTIDFVAPFILFEHHARGLMNLLDTWGGETLGWLAGGRGSSPVSQRLTELSEPAIVEIAARVPTINTWTPLLPAFAGALEQVPGDYAHQWRTTETIPQGFILDILTVQSPKWPPALNEYRESQP